MTSDLPLDEHARAQGIDVERRRWLTLTSMAGAAAAAATAVPFVSSFAPSERAKAAGASVEVDISSLAPGELKVVEWRGKPVWIMHRTPEQLAELEQIPGLADPASNRSDQPDYAKNTQRSIKPEVLVAVGICTHLGCSPVNVAKGSANPSVPAGREDSSAPVTGRPSIWRVASSPTSQLRPTSKSRRTSTWMTASC